MIRKRQCRVSRFTSHASCSVAPWHSASHDPPKALLAARIYQPGVWFCRRISARPSNDSVHPTLCVLLLPKFRSSSPLVAGPSYLRLAPVGLGARRRDTTESEGLVDSVDEWIHWIRTVLPRDPSTREGIAARDCGWSIRIHPLATVCTSAGVAHRPWIFNGLAIHGGSRRGNGAGPRDA